MGKNDLELLEIYMDMVEKQDEIIYRMTALLKSYVREIHNLRTTEDGEEPFADMTVNLPGYSLDPGEAFISGDISKDLLRFIKENKLGKVLPYQVQSGYGKYSAVAFDLEKLKAFDPKGVAEFRKEWNLPDKKPVKKKSRGMER